MNSPQTGRLPRVLIVEDDQAIAQMLSEALIEGGYEVVAAVTRGSEAIALAEKERPDVALMDIQLVGRRSGVEIAHTLREEFGARSFFLSSYGDDTNGMLAAQSYPLGWLAKPYRLDDVVRELNNLRDRGLLAAISAR